MKHDDAAQDKKMIDAAFKKRGLAGGGAVKYAKGGGVSNDLRASLGRNLAKTKFQTGKTYKSGRGR